MARCRLQSLALHQLHFSIEEIKMDESQTSEEKSKAVREFLPFWAKELVGMKDEAEQANKAEKSS